MLRRIDEIKAEGSVINIKITSDEDVKVLCICFLMSTLMP